MTLFHWTYVDNLASILKEGLHPKRKKGSSWCVYLSPKPDKPRFGSYEVCLKVDLPDAAELTCVSGCEEWELLYWGSIPKESIAAL